MLFVGKPDPHGQEDLQHLLHQLPQLHQEQEEGQLRIISIFLFFNLRGSLLCALIFF